MDIKPDNILIFTSPDSLVGTWKLADFGISFVLKRKLKRDKKDKTFEEPVFSAGDFTIEAMAQRGVGTHQAPEIQLAAANSGKDILIGRSSDIWSFAAISAEVLAFAVGGSESVAKFGEERKISHLDPKSYQFWEHTTNSSQTQEQSDTPSAPNVIISSEKNSVLDNRFRDAFKVSEKVTSYLQQIDRSVSLSKPWVKFITDALQVVPKERPSAHNLYLSVHEALHPEKHSSHRDAKTEPSGSPMTLSAPQRNSSTNISPLTTNQDEKLSGSLPLEQISKFDTVGAITSHSPVTQRRKFFLNSRESEGEAKDPSCKHRLAGNAKFGCFAKCGMIYLANNEIYIWNITSPTGRGEADYCSLPHNPKGNRVYGLASLQVETTLFYTGISRKGVIYRNPYSPDKTMEIAFSRGHWGVLSLYLRHKKALNNSFLNSVC